MEVFEKQILSFLARRDYTPQKLSTLTTTLDIAETDYKQFKAAFNNLRKTSQIAVGSKNLITLPEMTSRVIGTFTRNPRGFGFIVPHTANSYGDLYVGPRDSDNAMTGDTVIAKVVNKGVRSGRMTFSGIITEVIERGRNEFVGTLKKVGPDWHVQPEGRGFFKPILVEDISAKNAKEDDKVLIQIIRYPTANTPAQGVITEVLGKAGLYDSEIKSIIAHYRLPKAFNDGSIKQAQAAAENFNPDNHPDRDDITDMTIITIDPPNAKDFDDAISLQKNSDGNWILGVHIADVSSFIPMESPLDIEAKERGNSVYLPAKVIPMLPEILSNGICSLQPNQKRFAKSVYITYDRQGNVLSRNASNSIIQSKARLTYLQADAILKGNAEDFPGHVVALLKDMEILAEAIEKRRIKNGMLHLELPDTEVIFDETGKVIDAGPADDCYPHTMIEMFMVEANEAVAALMDRFNIPFMRRIHPEPAPTSTKKLARFVKISGLKIPRKLDRTAIQDLLNAAKGKSYEYAINLHVLRSMQKAEYAPLNIGHFALASKYYCHFTSPIRRYADLMVHRLLQCYLEHSLNKIGLDEVLPTGALTEIGKHITFTEQQAENAERELKTVLILQMLTEHIGEELEVVVSGLTNFGIFVQCRRFGIEALIEPGDLGIDEWKYDEKSQAVIGKYSGKSLHLGEPMKVTIVSISVPARQIIVAPTEPLVDSRTKLKGAKKRNRSKQKYKNKSRRR